jgi:23S rRNA (guanosine2251-2'-O)-methyltransferase
MEEAIDCLIYGRNTVREALRSKTPVEKIFFLQGTFDPPILELRKMAESLKVPYAFVDRQRLDRLTDRSHHQGVVARLAGRSYATLEEIMLKAAKSGAPPFLLACFQIQDPHNLGSLIRTGDGVGIHGIILPLKKSAGLTPAVSKVSSGADSYVPVARVSNLYETLLDLRHKGFIIIGATMREALDFRSADYSKPLVVVLGGEGRGLDRRILSICDVKVSIPLKGQIESLNVGVAGALILYEVLNQRESVIQAPSQPFQKTPHTRSLVEKKDLP